MCSKATFQVIHGILKADYVALTCFTKNIAILIQAFLCLIYIDYKNARELFISDL